MLAGEASIAHLLHLGQQGHAMDKAIPAHLAQRGEVEVAKAGVPHLGFLVALRRQVDWPCDVDVEHVEPAWVAVNLGKETPLLITNPHHAIFYQHLVPDLVKLADGDDVGGEAGQVVDVGNGAVLTVLAGQQDGVDPPRQLAPLHQEQGVRCLVILAHESVG